MAERDVEKWLADNGVSCVRLIATNHDGLVLGKHMSVPTFLSAVEKGSALGDTAFGVDMSGEVALGWDWGKWRGEVADIMLVPDPETLILDPNMAGWASAICGFTDMEGHPLPPCCRGLLRGMVERLAELGYTASAGPEVEFMVFEESIQEAREQGYAGLTPLGGSGRITYLMTRSRDLSEFVDAAVRRLDGLGIEWEYWSSETAPGQVEINLAPADPLRCADNIARTKLALREVAAELDRSVTFMAYGIDEHLGGGMHVNLSLARDGESAFHGEDGHTDVLRRWVAGLLHTMPGAMSFLSPTVNSYRRLVDITGPPTTVTWGEDNKSVAVRTVTREAGSSRIEHRVPSCDVNPYLALAAILAGGMVGLEDELEPPPEFEGMAWALPPGTAPPIPDSLKKATAALAADERLTEMLGREAVEYWLGSREWEWLYFHTAGGDPDAVGEFELRRYFEQT